MEQNIEKFLESKLNSQNETTKFCSLLILSSKVHEEKVLSSFTLSKVREILAERREGKWTSSGENNN